MVLWNIDKLKACKTVVEIQREYRGGDHWFKQFISHNFSLNISENKFLLIFIMCPMETIKESTTLWVSINNFNNTKYFKSAPFYFRHAITM